MKGITLAAHLLTFRCAAALGGLITGLLEAIMSASTVIKALPGWGSKAYAANGR